MLVESYPLLSSYLEMKSVYFLLIFVSLVIKSRWILPDYYEDYYQIVTERNTLDVGPKEFDANTQQDGKRKSVDFSLKEVDTNTQEEIETIPTLEFDTNTPEEIETIPTLEFDTNIPEDFEIRPSLEFDTNTQEEIETRPTFFISDNNATMFLGYITLM